MPTDLDQAGGRRIAPRALAGGYSAGRGYGTFRFKAVICIGGVEGEPMEGTS